MRSLYPADASESRSGVRDECVPNIGRRGRVQRAGFGVIALLLGIAIAAALVASDVARPWRLAVLPLFWGGALGVLQAYFHT
jgi:hypothetical protein